MIVIILIVSISKPICTQLIWISIFVQLIKQVCNCFLCFRAPKQMATIQTAVLPRAIVHKPSSCRAVLTIVMLGLSLAVSQGVRLQNTFQCGRTRRGGVSRKACDWWAAARLLLLPVAGTTTIVTARRRTAKPTVPVLRRASRRSGTTTMPIVNNHRGPRATLALSSLLPQVRLCTTFYSIKYLNIIFKTLGFLFLQIFFSFLNTFYSVKYNLQQYVINYVNISTIWIEGL